MKHEFHAQYDLLAHDDLTQAQAVDMLTGVSSSPPRKWPELAMVEDPAARLSLLAQALLSPYKDRARMGQQRGKPGGLWHWIVSGQAGAFLEERRERYLHRLGLLPSLPDLSLLPPGSFSLHFTFALRKPYLSRDDADWHILDNPVKKEWVFQVPYVAPTQWKGALRAAMMQQLVEQLNATDNETSFIEKRLQLYRLFGNEKDGTADFLNRALAHWRVGPRPENADDQRQKEREKRVDAETKKAAQEFDALLRKRGYRQGDVEGFQGRLYFYPAYFDQIGLEVINPHPRDTGAGKQPIYFECVPAGAQGTFTLLYVPLDGAGEAADDLEAVAQGIQAMMTVYGFGAKTSSGYGTARDCLSGDGTLALRATLPGAEPSPAAAEPPQPAPDLSRYLEAPTRLHADFRRPDGSLKSEAEYQALVESRGQKYARKDRQLYAKAKAWWEREDRHLAEAPAEEPEPAVQPAPSPAPPVAEWEFTTISELQEVAQKVATLLREGGVP